MPKPVSEARREAGRINGRLGGLTTSSRVDVVANTLPARTAFLAKFEAQVDPDGTLAVAERSRRAEAARKAYFLDMSLKAARAKKLRAQLAQLEDDLAAN